MARRFSDTERAVVWDMREAGVPVKRIARHLGRQNSSLRRFIATAGGQRPRLARRATQRRRLSRLRDMSLDPGARQLLDDITPTRAALQREHDTRATLEALQPGTKVATIGRGDPTRLNPTRHEIHIVERQLGPMNIQATQHGHGHLPIAQGHARRRAHMPSW